MSVLDVLADAWLQFALAGIIMITAVVVGSVLLSQSKDADRL